MRDSLRILSVHYGMEPEDPFNCPCDIWIFSELIRIYFPQNTLELI